MPDEGLMSDIRASSDIPQILFGFYTNFAVLTTTKIADECIFSESFLLNINFMCKGMLYLCLLIHNLEINY